MFWCIRETVERGCWYGGGAPGELAPGPRRPHPCGKDIMTFSLIDFFGYSMAVTSACDYLNLSPEDFHNWEVRLPASFLRLSKPILLLLVWTMTIGLLSGSVKAALLMLLIFRLILTDFFLSFCRPGRRAAFCLLSSW